MKVLSSDAKSLYHIYMSFEAKEFELPNHQRSLAWSDKQMKVWFKDLEKISLSSYMGGYVPGCVIVYKQGDNKTLFMNDGSQRAYWTIKKFIDYCNVKKKDWKTILQKVFIVVQQVEYRDSTEIIDSFVKMNCGTLPTPFELTQTVFCIEFGELFETFWKSRLKRVRDIVDKAAYVMGIGDGAVVDESKYIGEKRERRHKLCRDMHHLFWKFISHDTTRSSQQVRISRLTFDKWHKGTRLEKQLADELKNIGQESIDEQINKFERFIKRMTSLYLSIWNEQIDFKETPTCTHFRWWLLVTVYWANNNFDASQLRIFTEHFIQKTYGTTMFQIEDEKCIKGEKHTRNIALSELSTFGQLIKLFKIDLKKNNIRDRNSIKLRDGFVHSHKVPFSDNGNGETYIENSYENSIRGKKSMTDEEVTRLK